jgi:alkylation response protein AidB-like acyl-CoA dehydrogenase
MAVTDPDSQNRYSRASMFIVETDNPGFRIVRNISVMGDSGEGYFSHSEVDFEECRVPKSALFGKSGSGFKLAQERLGPGRIHHCMRWIGICERAFDLVCQRVSDRMISPKKRLGEEGVIQEWIAESRADIDAARLLVLKCANAIETEGPYSARTDVSIIKFFVAEVLKKVLDMAIQVHGALGMTDDTPLAFWYRHERGARIYDGPDEVHKRTVARQILKNYGT